MNLTLFFRLVNMVIYQRPLKHLIEKSETDLFFILPEIYAIDGFNISLQISQRHYYMSENGYREIGHTLTMVEFGYPNDQEELLRPYYEDENSNIGIVPISVLEKLFEKHGGIDWDKTLSTDVFNKIVNHSYIK